MPESSKRIVILGNTPEAFSALAALRAADAGSEIFLLSLDGDLPYSRLLLPDVLAQKIPPEKAFYREAAFFDEHRVVVLPQELTRVNFRRMRLTADDKETLDFDLCLITDTGWLFPPSVKGGQKSGVYLTSRFSAIRAALKEIPAAETVFVRGDNLTGLRFVLALTRWNKEVVWVTSRERILPEIFDAETAAAVTALLEQKAVRVIPQNDMVEILGDNDMKAVRLRSGKVIAGQMAFVVPESPDLRLLRDTGLDMTETVTADPNGRTNFENVFSCGGIAGFTDTDDISRGPSEVLAFQLGEAVAAGMAGKDYPVPPGINTEEIQAPGFDLFLAGSCCGGPDVTVYRSVEESGSSRGQISVREGRIEGALLLNSRVARDMIRSGICNQTMVSEQDLAALGFFIRENRQDAGPAEDQREAPSATGILTHSDGAF